jgi:hypothetical protein
VWEGVGALPGRVSHIEQLGSLFRTRGSIEHALPATKKLHSFISNLRIDLDMIGLYFGKYARISIFRRCEPIYEVAKEFRDNPDDREEHNE